MVRVWLASLTLLAGCTCDSALPVQTFACSTDDDCATGWRCLSQVCLEDGAGGGAGGGGGGGGAGGGNSPCVNDAQCGVGRRCVASACVDRLANGETCNGSEQCLSTFCVESVCCESACSGGCGDCTLPSSRGTCAPVAAGRPGSPACAPFLCNGVLASCPMRCASATECVAPLFCEAGGACVSSDLPRAVQPPTITTDAGFYPGATLYADAGTWGSSLPGPITVTHTWLRCQADGGGCVPLTAPGTFIGTQLQTDATRAAAVQGDGLLNDSSVGTWSAATNMVVNGGAEVDLSSYGAWAVTGDAGSFPSYVRDTADRKFGAASVVVTTNGAEAEQIFLTQIPGLSGSTPYVASAWLRAPAGATLCLALDEFDAAGAYLGTFGLARFSATGAWQRAATAVTSMATTVRGHLLVFTCAMQGQAISFRVDGVQLERGTSPTPYVETSGAPATRAASSLTGPASLLRLDHGWAAFRARPAWTGATANRPFPSLLSVGPSVTDKLHLYYFAAPGQWSLERNNGAQNPVRSTLAAAPGVSATVIGAWSPTQLFVSTNGAPFEAVSASQLPSPGQLTLELGPVDGELLWAVLGEGALSAAEASGLHAFGDVDPPFAALPRTARVLWTADSVAYTAAVADAASWVPTAAELGSTLRLEVTATNSAGSTTVTSAPFGPVAPPPPVNVDAPAVTVASGGYYRGGVLGSTQGIWTGAQAFAYQWERCDAMGQACQPVGGATTASYTLVAGDVGSRLGVTVTATNAGGGTSRASAATPVVVNPPPGFVGVGTAAQFTAATTAALPRAGMPAAGTLLLAFLVFTADPGAVTAPPGWTLATAQLQPALGPRLAVYWALAGANEPASHGFSWANAASGSGRVAAYQGAHPVSPIAAAVTGAPVAANRSATLPAVNAMGAYQLQVGFVSMTTASAFNGTLGGWSVRAPTFSASPNSGIADRVLAGAGSSGTAVWANTASGPQTGLDSVGISLLLRQP